MGDGMQSRQALMDNSEPKPTRFNWMIPSSAALAVVAVYLSLALWSADAAFLASVLVVGPALVLASAALLLYWLVLLSKRRQPRLTILATMAACGWPQRRC